MENKQTLIIKNSDSVTTKYLKTFFEEKNLPEVSFEVTSPNGTPNFIDNEVVIEHIMICPEHEKKQIAEVIRKIDFMNGNINHFLNHLASAIAQDM